MLYEVITWVDEPGQTWRSEADPLALLQELQTRLLGPQEAIGRAFPRELNLHPPEPCLTGRSQNLPGRLLFRLELAQDPKPFCEVLAHSP